MKKWLFVMLMLFVMTGCDDATCGGKDCVIREDGQPICNDGTGAYTRAACKGG